MAERKHIVVKSTIGSGLGDRLRSVISAILYARNSGRVLNVYWDDGLYGPEGQNVFPEFFEVKGVSGGAVPASDDLQFLPGIWQGQLHQPMKVLYEEYGPEKWNRADTIRLFSFDQSRIDYPEDVLVMWEFDQYGACDGNCHWGNLENTRELVRAHIAPTDSLRSDLDAFISESFSGKMIGLHIRETDEPMAGQKLVPMSSYHRLVKKIRRQRPTTGIFLATDNAEVEEAMKERYPELVTTDKWFGSAGSALHTSGERDDRLAGAREALLDMLLLASCDYLIYPANSSFSQCASYFSETPSDRLFPLSVTTGWRGVLGRLRNIK